MTLLVTTKMDQHLPALVIPVLGQPKQLRQTALIILTPLRQTLQAAAVRTPMEWIFECSMLIVLSQRKTDCDLVEANDGIET